jgi:predicted nucleotide-binding protein
LSGVLDQQFVVHLFVPADGPDGDAAYRALDEIWRGCGLLFQMTELIPGTALPRLLPPARAGIPPDGEVALAAQERPGANCQAVLRRHHDVFNLSIALAPPEAPASDQASPSGAEGWPWWRSFDYQWTLLTSRYAPHLLGQARLYLARVDAEHEIRDADPVLYAELSGLLPDLDLPGRPSAGVTALPGLAVWETTTEPDERALRRIVLAIAPEAEADAAASAWAWSRGDTAIPPLARYLLHAAKIRYEMRVWQRDSEARQLRASLDTLATELHRLGASDPAKAELLRLRRLDALLLHADLRALRRTVEIAADNLGRCLDLSGLMIPGGLFADDVDLARFLLDRLDDEVAYLGLASERAEHVSRLPAAAQPEPPAVANEGPRDDPGGITEDLRRNVFVVYGRDEPARRAVFDFLRALRLNPMEWETLVKATGKTAPFLTETVRSGLALAGAVVVLMTPEDVVRLHPELHEPDETDVETQESLQARPNVLLELGMALESHPRATLVLVIGDQRPVTDLGGLNFVRISDTPGCRAKIAARLKLAGCPVDDTGQDWLTAGDFAGLAASRRTP